VSVYIGLILVSPEVQLKLHEKHRGLTADEVREAVQWPARPQVRWETHPDHGRRLVVLGTTAEGREVITWLSAVDPSDGTWVVRTARYV
jgi:hypothetical protein